MDSLNSFLKRHLNVSSLYASGAPKMLLVFMLFSLSSYAATPSAIQSMRNSGLAYLFKQQDADGNWFAGSANDMFATALTLQAFSNNGIQSGLSSNLGLSWLANNHPLNINTLAWQAATLGQSGWNVEQQLATLDKARNNRFYGWGAYDKYQPSMQDTAIVHDAWILSGNNHPNAALVVSYLSVSQNTSGGWSYMAAPLIGATGTTSGSAVIPSTYAVLSLSRQIGAGFGSQSDIDQGLAWLLTRQLIDGGFADDDTALVGNAYETALFVAAITAAQNAGNTVALGASAAREQALDFLISTQSSDGSWGADTIATAMVLNALAPTAYVDSDSDGIPDPVELIIGTQQFVADAESLLIGIGDSIEGQSFAGLIFTGVKGQMVSFALPASGVVAAYQLVSGALPPGLALNSLTGEVTGSASGIGDFNFAYRATLSSGDAAYTVASVTIDADNITLGQPMGVRPAFTNSHLNESSGGAYLGGIPIGVVANVALRDALQSAQLLPSCVGDDSEACMPSLSTTEIGTLMMSSFGVEWSRFGINDFVGSVAPDVIVCGTIAGDEATRVAARFVGIGCSSANPDVFFSSTASLYGVDQSDVAACLAAVQSFGVGAIGFTTVDQTDPSYRYVKLNNRAPTLKEFVDGNYPLFGDLHGGELTNEASFHPFGFTGAVPLANNPPMHVSAGNNYISEECAAGLLRNNGMSGNLSQ